VPIEDVQDSETLEAYLDALPDGDRKQISVGIAYRAALRVFPIAAEAFLTTDWARKGNLTMPPILRLTYGNLSVPIYRRTKCWKRRFGATVKHPQKF